jgi:DNA-directed RNA polymerase specialized sigma24 family protein
MIKKITLCVSILALCRCTLIKPTDPYRPVKEPLSTVSAQSMKIPAAGLPQEPLDLRQAIAVRAALDPLPPNQRLAIVLRYYENLGYEDIASALETTTKAIERLLARGWEQLRDVLGRQENFFISCAGVFLFRSFNNVTR